MGPLVIVDPDLATPVKKWLAKVLQGILPGFCLGGIDAALVTRDREYVRNVKHVEVEHYHFSIQFQFSIFLNRPKRGGVQR